MLFLHGPRRGAARHALELDAPRVLLRGHRAGQAEEVGRAAAVRRVGRQRDVDLPRAEPAVGHGLDAVEHERERGDLARPVGENRRGLSRESEPLLSNTKAL